MALTDPQPDPTMTLRERIAAYVDGATFEKIDPAVVHKAKEVILYHLALAIRCKRDGLELGAQAVDIARRFSPQGGPSTLIGYKERAQPIDAAFANCSMMRAHGLDDVIFPAGIHAGLMTIPVVLALAESLGRPGRDVLSAVIVAYEVMGKLGSFSWTEKLPRRPTQVYGTLGSTIAAARILGLNRSQMANAIGYAVHSTQGIAEGDDGPGPGVPYHYYSTLARAGITGAVTALAGGLSSPTVMEGRLGFFQTFLGSPAFDADKYLASLGRDYQIARSVEKRYQGTGLNIVGIELLRGIVKENRLSSPQIRELRFLIPQERRNFHGGHSTGPFTSASEATGSVVYHMAMIMVDGDIDFRRYAQFADPEILAAIAKIKPILVPGKSNIRWTRVEVDTVDGRTLAREGENYTFAPIAPHERLATAAAELLTPQQIDRCFELIMHLDQQSTVGPLLACLIPA